MKFRPFGTLGNTIEKNSGMPRRQFSEDCQEPGFGRRALGQFGGTASAENRFGRDGMRLPEPLLRSCFGDSRPLGRRCRRPAVLRATPRGLSRIS
jgi:hypothetical protein